MQITRQFIRDAMVLYDALPGFNGAVMAQELYAVSSVAGKPDRLLRRPVGAELMRQGRLTVEQWRAALEIEAVFQAVTLDATPKKARLGTVSGGKSTSLPSRLDEAYMTRYVPWRDWAGRETVSGSTTLADITLLFAVDNAGLRQIEQRFRLRNGRALGLIAPALDAYWMPLQNPSLRNSLTSGTTHV